MSYCSCPHEVPQFFVLYIGLEFVIWGGASAAGLPVIDRFFLHQWWCILLGEAPPECVCVYCS